VKSKKQKNPDSKTPADFFEMIYQVARLIPRGRVTSYGAIAKYLGAAGSSRLVGYAMNGAGSKKPKVPAHRVVNRSGQLTGKFHFSTPYEMQELLEKEKIKVKDDRIVDFKKHFWDPNTELQLP
jgi:methylated-DNA-protein-cysteine methyltransferase-like protein